MAIKLPDVNSMRTRFPEFSSVSESTIGFAIEEAAKSVDETWLEQDQITAISLLAAHLISEAAATSGTDGRIVQSESIGPISVSYAQPLIRGAASGLSLSSLNSTTYGKRFASMLRKNFPPVIQI